MLFGQECEPVTGAMLIYECGSGGHVGFDVGLSDMTVYVLGGDQPDAVIIGIDQGLLRFILS